MSGEATRFGKYRLLQRIGTGGMGEVHLAKLTGPSGFEKLVVIKRLLENRQNEKKYIDMFFREANLAAQLNHSNIVQIYEVGEQDGVHYIAMEYVQGKSLRRLIDRCYEQNRHLPAAYVVQIISEMCAGLAFAHNAHHLSGAPLGLIHRDINPHNVLVSYRGEIKIIDFGIAKSELTLDKTQAGTIKGTVVYMSPEQSSGQKLDKRSDLFAVGICLYEALSNNNPFHKDSLGASLDAIRRAELPPMPRPEMAPFADIIKVSLARNPDDRYSDCSELADALLKLTDDNTVPRANMPLSKFMVDLFTDDIRDEERLLSQTELAEMPSMGATMSTVAEMEHAKTTADSPNLSDPSWHPEQTFFASVQQSLERLWSKSAVRLACGALLIVAGSWGVYFKASSKPVVPLAEPATIESEPPDEGTNIEKPAKPEPQAPVIKVPTPPPPVARAPSPPAPAPAAPPQSVSEDNESRHSPKHSGHKKSVKHHAEPVAEASNMGSLQVLLDPPTRILNNGAAEGRSFRLHSGSGSLTIGTPTDAYVIRVRYKVDNKTISYSVESEPWANVSGAGGIALGRTPLEGVTGGNTTVFEFANPKLQNSQRVTLRFSP